MKKQEAATATKPTPNAAPAEPAATGGKKPKRRMRPFGLGIVEKVSAGYLFGLCLILYAFGQFLSHPLDDLRYTEVRLDVQRIIDGDTFIAMVQPYGYSARFRLKRIDAPELDQQYGPEAREALERLLIGDVAAMRLSDTARKSADLSKFSDIEVIALLDAQDDWGRYVVDVVTRSNVSSQTTYVQKALVEQGFAWVFSTFARGGALKTAMEEAKAAKRGLWASDSPMEPWTYRWDKRGGGPAKHQQHSTAQRVRNTAKPPKGQPQPGAAPAPRERRSGFMKPRRQ
jgi:micrococcal nuclease